MTNRDSQLDQTTRRRDLIAIGVGALAAGGLAGRLQGLVEYPGAAETDQGASLVNRLSEIVTLDQRDLGPTLQSRIDAVAGLGGGTIELVSGAEGEGLLRETMLLSPNVRIRGRGKGRTRIRVEGDFPAFAAADPLTRTDNCELSNLTITRSGSDSTSPIVDWTGISHSRLQDLTIDQSGGRGQSVGVAFGASSYYNDVGGVQVRGTHIGMSFKVEANANRVIGNNVILDADIGFVVDNTNSTVFVGASVEGCDEVGFCFQNGSKQNQILACRVEDVPIGFQTLFGVAEKESAFDNYFLANVGYPRGSGPLYDLQTSNTVVDTSANRLNGGTFIEAEVGSAENALGVDQWTVARYGLLHSDALAEFDVDSAVIRLKSAGIFGLTASALLTTPQDGTSLELSVFVNAVERRRLDTRNSSEAGQTQLSGSADIRLSEGDVVEVKVRSAGPASITAGAGSVMTFIKHN